MALSNLSSGKQRGRGTCRGEDAPGQDLAVREGTAAGSTNLTRASKRVTGKAGYAVDTPYIIVTRVSGCGYVPTWYNQIWIWQY